MTSAPEVKAALVRAAAEIRQLRAENHVLSAQMRVFNIMADQLYAQAPSGGVGMSEDIAYTLDKLAGEIPGGARA